MKYIINTIQAPAAIGPYSQAVEINGTLYISGQIPIVRETGKIIEGGIKDLPGTPLPQGEVEVSKII